MKLIGTLGSPYTRKVRVVFAEKRIDYDFEVHSPSEPGSPVPEFNPLGKVPVLVLDDGTTIFDSRVIVEYLDGVSPVARLIPETSRQRIQVRRWEALADGILDAAVLTVYEGRRAKPNQSMEWIERQMGKVDSALKHAADELEERPWCYDEGFIARRHRARVCAGVSRLPFPRDSVAHGVPESRAARRETVQAAEFRDERSGRLRRSRGLPAARRSVTARSMMPPPRHTVAVVDHHRLPGRDGPLGRVERHLDAARCRSQAAGRIGLPIAGLRRVGPVRARRLARRPSSGRRRRSARALRRRMFVSLHDDQPVGREILRATYQGRPSPPMPRPWRWPMV